MDILILGGTGFIGPHLVRHAVARGHRVTIFTRGRRDAELPASVVRLIGDRNGKLEALEGKRWDAVIDDSATNPEYVRLSTTLLKDATGAYLFTSSTGVHYPYRTRDCPSRTPWTTSWPILKICPPSSAPTRPAANDMSPTRSARAASWCAHVHRRSGDTTDRFPYWPQRLMKGGEVLAPGKR
jgi:2'-hydroxyisoflavone reductase